MRPPRFLRIRRGQVGFVIVLVMVCIALAGPDLAPHAAADIVGEPALGPSLKSPLGTDFLGRDVLSRVLWGGRSVLVLAVAATAIAFVVGTMVGLVAGYSRNFLDPLLMRIVDVVLSFPPLLFFLIVTASVGSGEFVLTIGIAIVLSPGVARIVYSLTKEVSVRFYVEAAVARGERTRAILVREVLPNIMGPLIANVGITFTFSILLVAAVNFLGLGLQPPAANWALMISENRPILQLDVWATVVPATLIGALTVGANLLGDAVAQSLGRSDVGQVGNVAGLDLATAGTGR